MSITLVLDIGNDFFVTPEIMDCFKRNKSLHLIYKFILSALTDLHLLLWFKNGT